jgi:pyrophosphatase PpaX
MEAVFLSKISPHFFLYFSLALDTIFADMIKTLLFDLDGTLVNTWSLIVASFRDSGLRYNFSTESFTEDPYFKSCTLEQAYHRLAPHLDFKVTLEAHKKFQNDNLHLSEPFLNSRLVLERLRPTYNIGVVTSRQGNSFKILSHCGLLECIDIIVAAEDVTWHKPHPEGIHHAMDYFGSWPEETAYVGDTPTDIRAGKSIGVTTIGVSSNGFGELLKQSEPDFVIGDLIHLPSIIENVGRLS